MPLSTATHVVNTDPKNYGYKISGVHSNNK